MQKLTDFIDSFQIYGLCIPCGRMEALPLTEIVRQQGPDITLQDLRGRLRCRQCKRRSEDLRVVYVGREGAAAAFHYRR